MKRLGIVIRLCIARAVLILVLSSIFRQGHFAITPRFLVKSHLTAMARPAFVQQLPHSQSPNNVMKERGSANLMCTVMEFPCSATLQTRSLRTEQSASMGIVTARVFTARTRIHTILYLTTTKVRSMSLLLQECALELPLSLSLLLLLLLS